MIKVLINLLATWLIPGLSISCDVLDVLGFSLLTLVFQQLLLHGGTVTETWAKLKVLGVMEWKFM